MRLSITRNSLAIAQSAINGLFFRLRSLECDVYSSAYARAIAKQAQVERLRLAQEFSGGLAASVAEGDALPFGSPVAPGAGLPAAAATSCTQITVSAPYTGDSNANSTTQVEYNTADAWPGTTACASSGSINCG